MGKLGIAKPDNDGTVERVDKGGQAETLGVKAGWTITAVDGQPFTPDDLIAKTQGSREYTLTFNKAFTQLTSDLSLVPSDLRTEKLQLQVAGGQKVVVLVACGSFSPPTSFHMRLMEDAKDAMQAKGYHVAGGFLSPCHQKYGKRSLVPMHHRVNMVGLALQDSNWLQVDDWECAQEEYTLTAEVLRKRYVASLPYAQVILTCGGDLLESFTKFNSDGTPVWTAGDQQFILGSCGICCMAREGTDLAKVINGDALLKKHEGNITVFNPSVANNVSSTLVRELLQQGKSLKYLVHDEVLNYIHGNRLKDYPAWQPPK